MLTSFGFVVSCNTLGGLVPPLASTFSTTSLALYSSQSARETGEPWLACDRAHRLLRRVWTQQKDWIVAEYVLLPDHLHLIAYPAGGKLPFDPWVKAWKSLFSRTAKNPDWRWQSTCFHHRIRNWENAESKIRYIKQNPVRLGLIERADDWPFAGRLFEPNVIW